MRAVKHHAWGWSVLPLGEVYRMQAKDEARYQETYRQADIIVTRLMDGRVPEYVRTDYIKSEFPSKTVVIPNLYFNGLDPDAIRVYKKDGSVVKGLLGDYHLNMIHYAYVNRWSIEQAIKLWKSGDMLKWYSNSVEKSISMLCDKEDRCDIKVVDYIKNDFQKLRLFHVYNHPTNYLMSVLLHGLVAYVGLCGTRTPLLDQNFMRRQELSFVQMPIHPALQNHYDINFEVSGFEFTTAFDQDGMMTAGGSPRKRYTIDDVAAAFYETYKRHGIAQQAA